MSDPNTTPPEGTDPVLNGHTEVSTGPVRRTQAGYDRARRAVKEQAKEVVEEEAKKAIAKKKRHQSKAIKIEGLEDFHKKAKQVEAEINNRSDAEPEDNPSA